MPKTIAGGREPKNALKVRSSRKLTRTGILLYTAFALALIGGWAVGQIAPESSVGVWFTSPIRAVLAFVGLWLFFTIATVIAAKLGHPVSRKN